MLLENYNYSTSSVKQSFTSLLLSELLIYFVEFDIMLYHLLHSPSTVSVICLSIVFCPKQPRVFVPPSLCRCVHVGDLDVRHQAFPGGEEQWRDWQDRERRAIGYASSVPAHPLQFDDQMLVVRPQQAAAIHRTQNTTQVINVFVSLCLQVLVFCKY